MKSCIFLESLKQEPLIARENSKVEEEFIAAAGKSRVVHSPIVQRKSFGVEVPTTYQSNEPQACEVNDGEHIF